jgi:hypothetical protein
MYWVGPPVPGVYESAAGYGQFTLPSSPQEAAKTLCGIMGGTWKDDSLECDVAGQVYGLPDFDPSAMPSDTCAPEEVMTPAGCKPIPGGDEPPPDPGNGTPTPSDGEGTPDWVLPVAIGGIAAVAVVALVMTK